MRWCRCSTWAGVICAASSSRASVYRACWRARRPRGGQVDPPVRFDEVLRNAVPMGVADAQIELRGGVPLICGLAVPPRGEAVARVDAASLPVAHAQVELGRGVTALGGLAVPGGGFTVVAGNAVAGRVPHAHLELRGGVPVVGRPPEPRRGLGLIVRHAQAPGMDQPQVVLGLGQPLLGCLAAPSERRRHVLRHAVACRANPGEAVLGKRISAIRLPAQFGQRLRRLPGPSRPRGVASVRRPAARPLRQAPQASGLAMEAGAAGTSPCRSASRSRLCATRAAAPRAIAAWPGPAARRARRQRSGRARVARRRAPARPRGGTTPPPAHRHGRRHHRLA